MGRNAAIRRYDAKAAGQPLELLPGSKSRLPVILELLSSPWIIRGSDLSRREGSASPRHLDEDVDVEWDADRRCPRAFIRSGRRYSIDAVVQAWVTERAWWDPRSRISTRHWRVLSQGGIYDLVFDRMARRWRLVGILD